jgi:hypothetical protein
LLGEQMFKVLYGDTNRRRKRKSKQRQNEEQRAALAENSSTELTAGLGH